MANVLVYSGAGVSQSALGHTINTLRTLLPSYDVQAVQARSLALDPWPGSTSLLVIPGGRDLPYVEALSKSYQQPSGAQIAADARIADFVGKQGGAFLGICAGAYYASSFCDFEQGTPLEVQGERPALRFFPGTCKGTVYPGFVYESDAGSRIAHIELLAKQGHPKRWAVHYNGGGAFMHADSYADKGVKVLARYMSEDAALAGHPKSPYAGQAAAVLCNVGRGHALLFGVHPEFPLTPKGRMVNKVRDPSTLPTSEEILADQEEARLEELASMLEALGLEVRSSEEISSKVQTELSKLSMSGTAPKPPSITDPPRLSPLVLAGSESGVVEDIVKSLMALAHPSKPVPMLSPAARAQDPEYEEDVLQAALMTSFSDVNDGFHIFQPSERVEKSLASLCQNADYSQYRSSKDTDSPEQVEEGVDPADLDLNKVPKNLLAYAGSTLPSSNIAPYFDAHEFLASLKESRGRLRDEPILQVAASMWGDQPVSLASAFMYGQVVTSTQTMLDK